MPLPSLDYGRLQQAASRSVPETPPELLAGGVDAHLQRGRRRAKEMLTKFEERIDDIADDADTEGMREIETRAESAL